MRTLEFLVSDQRLRKNPECDFSGIVAGSIGHLKAVFSFSENWGDCKKAASFWVDDHEYPVLLEDDSCVIPKEALTGEMFKVSVMGAKPDYKITTNKVKVRQEVQ